MEKLKGCGTALITPFDKNLEIDYQVFKKLVQRQIEANVDFLVPLGTTGEVSCLEDDEKQKLLEITSTEVSGCMPIVVGAGSNSTKHALKNIKMLEKVGGADAFLVITPYYNKPTQHGLYHHFRTIAEATDKPIILYNIPGRTAVNMLPETCLKLAEIKNIVGIKEASGNYDQISEIIRNAPDGFTVLSGNDNETLSLIATGAKGVISAVANVAPKRMSVFLDLLLEGNFTEARKAHHKLSPLFKNCFVETNPIAVKAGMSQMNLIENFLRPPLYPASEKTLMVMQQTLKDLNI